MSRAMPFIVFGVLTSIFFTLIIISHHLLLLPLCVCYRNASSIVYLYEKADDILNRNNVR